MAGTVNGAGLDAHLVLRRSTGFELDIDLTTPPGVTGALLGPNGSGKTTAVAAICGLAPLDRGHVSLDGVVLDDPSSNTFVPAQERRVGVVFQDYLLFPHLSVLDNVAFGARSRGATRDEARERAGDWTSRVGLGGLESRKPGDLSGGQAQRVALARALATEPDILLLDEPLAALDVTTRRKMRESLADHLDDFGGPRLLITHDPSEAFLLADHVDIIEEGKITQSGTPDEIRLRPRTRYAADLAGSNLVAGTAEGGVVRVEDHVLHVADEISDGPVYLIIHPAAISVHRHRPGGSPRNAWSTRVDQIEDLGARARLRTGAPLSVVVEVTGESVDELDLHPGTEVWVAIKATEIGVQPR